MHKFDRIYICPTTFTLDLEEDTLDTGCLFHITQTDDEMIVSQKTALTRNIGPFSSVNPETPENIDLFVKWRLQAHVCIVKELFDFASQVNMCGGFLCMIDFEDIMNEKCVHRNYLYFSRI